MMRNSQVVTIVGIMFCALMIIVGTAAPVTTVGGVTIAQAQAQQSQPDLEVDISVSNLSGDGSESNPYQISNASELQAMEDDLDANYELVSDIDASDTAEFNNGTGFDPVGPSTSLGNQFTGVLDGNNHTVTGLTIDRPDEDRLGLFGVSRGTITDVTLTNATVTGTDTVAGLVGINSGTIRNATASGTVTGTNTVAGLVGRNGNNGQIQIARASVTVTGTDTVAGLVGNNFGGGTIRDTFAVGSVISDSDDTDVDVGGLLGDNSGTVAESYFDTRTTARNTSAGNATGLTTAEMQGAAAKSNMTGLGFGESWRTVAGDYPRLLALADSNSNEGAGDPPSFPGEVTAITSENPSPTENRGVFAGVSTYSTITSLGGVGDNAIIFQGEGEIRFEESNGTEIDPSTLRRTAGDNEGVTLESPIPQDQPEGSYSNGAGFSVTVQEPRVITLEVQNNGENDVSGGILGSGQNNASVFVEYNYENAENIELTVEDETGFDVTGEAVDLGEADNKNSDSATPTGTDPDGEVRFEINPRNLDDGEYTFSVAGVEDLDFGQATNSVTTTISANQAVSLSVSENTTVQGSEVRFSIENSTEGEFHPVVIDESEFRDRITLAQAQAIFRSTGNTVETGVANSTGPLAQNGSDVEYAYAIVEIDGGSGVGSVETQFLKNNSTTIELYPSDGTTPIESHPPGVVFTTQDPGMTATANFTLANQDQEQPIVSEYAGEDGEVGPFDVIEAIDDFRQQELGPFEVLEIIEALRD